MKLYLPMCIFFEVLSFEAGRSRFFLRKIIKKIAKPIVNKKLVKNAVNLMTLLSVSLSRMKQREK
jgi:hypothetical protein